MVWEAVVGIARVRGSPSPAKVVRSTVMVGLLSGTLSTFGIAVFAYCVADKAAIFVVSLELLSRLPKCIKSGRMK